MRLQPDQGLPRVVVTSVQPRSWMAAPARCLVVALGMMALAALSSALVTASWSLGLLATALLGLRVMVRIARDRLNAVAMEIAQPARLEHRSLDSPQHSPVLSHCCAHSAEAFAWKKRLVEQAQREVILSGNYVGGEAFGQILDVLESKLAQGREFRACILGSDLWIDAALNARLQRLQQTYGTRFVWIKTEKYAHRQSGLPDRQANNHVKALVIDGGRAVIMGGSGLENKYAFSDGLTRHTGERGTGLVHGVIARNFRDMDWVFARAPAAEGADAPQLSPARDVGAKVRYELLKLGMLYQEINRTQGESATRHDLFAAFPMPEGECLWSRAPDLAGWPDTQLEVMAQGPTDAHSLYSRRLAELIDQARERIVIHHQFFNPSAEIVDALVRALNERRVHVIICSNFDNNGRDSPKAHAAFVPGNRLQLQRMAQRLSGRALRRLQCFEFGGRGAAEDVPRKATLHKKVVVIDRHVVIAGSSNLGYKSCVENTDYEINFVARSAALGRQTERLIAEDRLCGERRVNRLQSGLLAHAVRFKPLGRLGLIQFLRGWFFVRFLARHIN
jgi:phosphatidylserine/phosphatidylglycerophosphate/cardiolipin synthase-like enzyme